MPAPRSTGCATWPPNEAVVRAALLSIRTSKRDGKIERVLRKYLTPSPTCHPKAAEHNSASAVDRADKAPLLDLHVMIDHPQQMTMPFWDFVSGPANPASV